MHLGVHAAALDVDGAVDSPRVREAMPDVDPSHFGPPSAICDEIVHLINQPKSAWTFQADLRSFVQWRPRAAAKKQGPPTKQQGSAPAPESGACGSPSFGS